MAQLNNGDFRYFDGDPSSPLGPDNPLQDWPRCEQTVGTGTIEAFSVADSTTGSGRRIDVVLSGTSPTDEYVIEQTIGSVSTIGQTQAAIGRYSVDESAAGGPSSTLELQYLDANGDATGSAGAAQNGDATGARAGTGGTAPADAASLRTRVVISGSEGDGTVSLYRVYLDAGNTAVVGADSADPTKAPWTAQQTNGSLAVLNGAGKGFSVGENSNAGAPDAAQTVNFSARIFASEFIQLPVIASDPITPQTGLRLYAKLDGGVARLFYKDDGGTEYGPL